MTRRLSLFALFALICGLCPAFSTTTEGISHRAALPQGKVVVANRASGTISVIDVATDTVLGTHTLPGTNPAEPMYVVYSRTASRRVFVGDRANNQVVAYDADTFAVVGTAPAGNGVFHMWADAFGRQLWVNNDVDNTTTVIDPRTLQVLATVPTPADLVALGGKPHDVFVHPFGLTAWISVVGVSGTEDYVVRFSTVDFQEKARASVGKDPHLFYSVWRNRLYVPSQNSSTVTVFRPFSLHQAAQLSIPAAHGVFVTRFDSVMYVANISGGGTDGLYTVRLSNTTLFGDPVDTPFPTPHNITATRFGEKLYVTHSGGSANQVSVYDTGFFNPTPVLATTVTVENNPFGLAFVPSH